MATALGGPAGGFSRTPPARADFDDLPELLELRRTDGSFPGAPRSPFDCWMLGELDGILARWSRDRLVDLLDRAWPMGPIMTFELSGLEGANPPDLRTAAAAILGDGWCPTTDGESLDGTGARIHAHIRGDAGVQAAAA